jgi:uncharacterized membrane protein
MLITEVRRVVAPREELPEGLRLLQLPSEPAEVTTSLTASPGSHTDMVRPLPAAEAVAASSASPTCHELGGQAKASCTALAATQIR